jgi:hypothetical protein
MATRTVEFSGGNRFLVGRGRPVVFSVGTGFAVASVPWNTSTPKPKGDWLPAANVDIGTCPKCNTGIKCAPVWYRAFHELFERRIGGQYGQTIPQVATTVTQTQAQVVATANYTDAVAGYARGIAGSVDALTDVAQSNSLSGAATVPDTPEPPSRADALGL